MKKYLAIVSLLLFSASPVLAKNEGSGAQMTGQQGGTTVTSVGKVMVSPSAQVVNRNEVSTKNQGEEKQLMVETSEKEMNGDVVNSSMKVSDQVHDLIGTLGAKGGIGQEVKDIAQNQTKLQEEIKGTVGEMSSRSGVLKFLVGSDKKLVKTMEQQLERNKLMIQQLEQLKLEVKNTADLKQLQETIDSMVEQNTVLQERIGNEGRSNGIFGWLINLFSK